MKNIWIIGKYTFKEALSRKVFVTFFAVTTFLLLISAIIFYSTNINIMVKTIHFGKNNNFNLTIYNGIKLMVVSPLFGIGLFLSIFSASNFIPNMLEKGNIEFLLSKPISKAEIILGKFSGVSLMVFANIAYAIAGFWVLMGVKFGIWDANILLAIFTITFAFCLLYSLIILTGIITKSSLSAMMISYLIFIVFSPLLGAREKLALLIGGKLTKSILDFLYYVTPQTHDLSNITEKLATGQQITNFSPLLISFAFILIMIFASVKIFEAQDY